MKKILDLAHENQVNILDGYGIGINIHGYQPNPRNGHLCTKISSLLIAIVSHCMTRISLKIGVSTVPINKQRSNKM